TVPDRILTAPFAPPTGSRPLAHSRRTWLTSAHRRAEELLFVSFPVFHSFHFPRLRSSDRPPETKRNVFVRRSRRDSGEATQPRSRTKWPVLIRAQRTVW